MSHQEGEEERYTEGVGSMGREETVIATTISIGYIDQMAYLRVVGRTPTRATKGLTMVSSTVPAKTTHSPAAASISNISHQLLR